MRVTVDKAGRLVIPKALREAAGIGPGSVLEVRLRDGHLEIELAPPEVELVDKDGVMVAVHAAGAPHLAEGEVRAAQKRIRAGSG